MPASGNVDVGNIVLLELTSRTAGCVLVANPDRRWSPGAHYSKLTKTVFCSSIFYTGEARHVTTLDSELASGRIDDDDLEPEPIPVRYRRRLPLLTALLALALIAAAAFIGGVQIQKHYGGTTACGVRKVDPRRRTSRFAG